MTEIDTTKLTRVNFVDKMHNIERRNINVELSVQDDGKTLKVFVTEPITEATPSDKVPLGFPDNVGPEDWSVCGGCRKFIYRNAQGSGNKVKWYHLKTYNALCEKE